MKDTPLYKKAVFQAARRAMLENELVLREFVQNNLPEHYGEKEMIELNELLEGILDNDLFDVVMGVKEAEEFSDRYNIAILKDIEDFSKVYREKKKLRQG
ncbi:succinate dehydrogenase assembly factor 2 [Limisalsivibrio acetivorans]|uniref:FAD assembly factor SdhE n=1 Tax=Limisalsivibrio acetivorans TaxID=1304888 RepID=UPI0003B4503C|nr:succinate dehydrogenase assembly factor 2 [Limisalsivibrio acetivorans]